MAGGVEDTPMKGGNFAFLSSGLLPESLIIQDTRSLHPKATPLEGSS